CAVEVQDAGAWAQVRDEAAEWETEQRRERPGPDPRAAERFGLGGLRQGGHGCPLSGLRLIRLVAAACASADGVSRPTIAGASCMSSSFSSASTMNSAKSTRRVRLLSRTGSP